MFWGCITYYGVGDACWLQGKVDADAYVDVLKDYVLQSRDWYCMDPATFVFQQDNASIHTARIIKKYFSKSKIQVLDWPPNSPDLNPIKHVWKYINHQLGQYQQDPSDMNEL